MSKQAQIVTILPTLKSASMISLGKLCNDDYDIHLEKDTLIVQQEKFKRIPQLQRWLL